MYFLKIRQEKFYNFKGKSILKEKAHFVQNNIRDGKPNK